MISKHAMSSASGTKLTSGPRKIDTNGAIRSAPISRSVVEAEVKADFPPAPILKRGDNAWVAGTGKDSNLAKVKAQITSILNKLTKEKFERLSTALVEIGITTFDEYRAVIDMTAEKAISNIGPCKVDVYADLIVKLSRHSEKIINSIISVEKQPDGWQVNFMRSDAEAETVKFIEPKWDEERVRFEVNKHFSFPRFFLNICQREFEGLTTYKILNEQRQELDVAIKAGFADDKKTELAFVADKMQMTKRRTIGNIHLIAELFKRDMLSSSVLLECLKKLLGNDVDHTSELDVEAACKLLESVGKQLEGIVKPVAVAAPVKGGPKGASPPLTPDQEKLSAFWDTLKGLSKADKIGRRIRFMCQDVLDVKKKGWIPRWPVLGSMTLAEIRQEHEEELKRNARAPRASKVPGQPGGRGGKVREDKRQKQASQAGAVSVDSQSIRDVAEVKVLSQARVKVPPPGLQLLARPAFAAAPVPVASMTMLGLAKLKATLTNVLEAYLGQPGHATRASKGGTMAKELDVLGSSITELLCSTPADRSVFVTISLTHVFRGFSVKKDNHKSLRLAVYAAIQGLVSKLIVTSEAVEFATRDIFRTIMELKLEIPSAPSMVGEFLGYMHSYGVLPLARFAQFVQLAIKEAEGDDYLITSFVASDMLAVALTTISTLSAGSAGVEEATSAAATVPVAKLLPACSSIEAWKERNNLKIFFPVADPFAEMSKIFRGKAPANLIRRYTDSIDPEVKTANFVKHFVQSWVRCVMSPLKQAEWGWAVSSFEGSLKSLLNPTGSDVELQVLCLFGIQRTCGEADR